MKISYDWASLLTVYKKYVTKNSLVLEIGASNIERTRDLSKHCQKLTGVELYMERIPHDFGNVKYLVGDWEDLTKVIKPNSIDVAIASHVIEHLRDDLKAINRLYVVLKSRGVAILNTPNRKRLTRVVLEKFLGEKKFPSGEHEREYTEEDLMRLLRRSNFKKYEIEPVVFGLHGGSIFLYLKKVPKIFRKWANFWQIVLFKD